MRECFDTVLIGAGPANLSIAALCSAYGLGSVACLEARTEAAWHEGTLWPSSDLQVHPLKDLVSYVCPTSRHSLHNYLHQQGLLSLIVNNASRNVPRSIFSEYLRWAADDLATTFGVRVLKVNRGPTHFTVETSRGDVHARNVVIGVGKRPRAPKVFHGISRECWTHSSDAASKKLHKAVKKVAVVGGGQSGAELIANLLRCRSGPSTYLVWITGRRGVRMLDTSPFADEHFTEMWSDEFRQVGESARLEWLESEASLISGVHPQTLSEIYDALTRKLISGEEKQFAIIDGYSVIHAVEQPNGVALTISSERTRKTRVETVDHVYLATGFDPSDETSLFPERNTQADSSRCVYRSPEHGGGLYLNNTAAEIHGVSEGFLANGAVRAARIINDIAQREAIRVIAQRNLMGI